LLACLVTTGSGTVTSVHKIGAVPCTAVTVPSSPVPVNRRAGTIEDSVFQRHSAHHLVPQISDSIPVASSDVPTIRRQIPFHRTV
jgi:hypothetical protein